jgi:L-glyceraldehyde 3-phosphate reductase
MQKDLASYRDELVVSTKAGWDMWPGPYGDFGSRKYLLASLDQSLLRMGLDYVDIFYHHRPDPETPLEETLGALDHAVRSGKALYAGISQYSAEQTKTATAIMRVLGTPCLIHQPRYSMFDRWIEDGLLEVLQEEGVGCIVFSPLEQGILTNRYLQGIPEDSRAGKPGTYLTPDAITLERLDQVRALDNIATQRHQSLAQLAVSWVLRHTTVTSALVGASRVSQIEELVASRQRPSLEPAELERIENILTG